MSLKSPLREMRICFVGESFVNGTGDPECLGWTGRICVSANKKGYDITYYNLGVRRETSRELSSRWLREVSYRLPQEDDGRVVFSFGVNDTTIENGKTRVPLTESIANIHSILSEAQKLYPILMVSPPPIGDAEQNQRIADLSQEFALICQELNVPYLDVFSHLINSHIWLEEVKNHDGAHPQSLGYLEFAQIVENWDAWLNWFPEKKDIALQEIAQDIVSNLRYDISMDEKWRQRLFHAPVGQRFNIPVENEYGLTFATFNDGVTDDQQWVIGIESIDFPEVVEYTTNGIL
jgi:lysophospholipase L1-like esterase